MKWTLRRRDFVRYFWTGTAAFMAISITFPGVPSAEEAAADLRVEFHGKMVAVQATNVALYGVLTVIGNGAEFAVERTQSADPEARITGMWDGELADVLASLLRAQNHVLIHAPTGRDGEAGQAKLTRILLMGPSVPRPDVDPTSVDPRPADDPPTGKTNTAGDETEAPDGLRGRFAGTVSWNLGERDHGLARNPPESFVAPGKLAEKLDRAGNALADVRIDPRQADIARTIDLAGDVPVATYVMAHQSAGPSLQRTDLGAWVPWDGRKESLIDNRFGPSDQRLTFEVVRGDLSNELFPITFTIAYRTTAAFKFGVFQATPAQPPGE